MSYQSTQGLDANITAFDSRVFGGGFSFGIPISETNSIFTSINYENTQLSEDGFFAQEVVNFLNKEGSRFDVLRASLGFAYDTLNRAIFPDRGQLHRIVGEIAVPSFGNSLEFYKISYKTQYFRPLFADFTLAIKGDLGYGKAYGATSELPFFENYYAGGPRSVRGFKENTLGPRDNFDNPLGGNIKLIAGAEIVFPIPFVEVARDSVRLQAFLDAGNVYNDSKLGNKFDIGELRYSVGVGAIWLSPFGMVSVSYAKPFNVKKSFIDGSGFIRRGDEVQQFQFNFGSSF
jgi:outer membrane protein insertion porin family